MSDLVKKVARRICVAHQAGNPAHKSEPPEIVVNAWEPVAKAAIATVLRDMQEPSEAMIEEGIFCTDLPRDIVIDLWQDMLKVGASENNIDTQGEE